MLIMPAHVGMRIYLHTGLSSTVSVEFKVFSLVRFIVMGSQGTKDKKILQNIDLYYKKFKI